jgi:hypothetical protein
MSDLQDVIAANTKRAVLQGATRERERILKNLRQYFELSQEPDEDGNVEVNEEWDCGFQAALALIANEYNHPRQNRE